MPLTTALRGQWLVFPSEMGHLRPIANCPHCGQKWPVGRRWRRRSFILLWYVFLVSTVFHEWYDAHQLLADSLWYGMLALVALSWIVTRAKRI